MKRGNKGQFYIIAAVIIIVLILGLVTVVNKGVVQKRAERFFDLSKNFEDESIRIVDHGVYNQYSPAPNITQKLAEFYGNYSEYALAKDPNLRIVYVYGDEDGWDGQITDVVAEGSLTDISGAGLDVTQVERKELSKTLEEERGRVKVNLSGTVYDFNLGSGEKFYFVILTKKEGEVVVKEKLE